MVVDLLREEETLDVDRLGLRKDVGGVGIETRRELLAALSLLARLGGRACWPGGTGVAFGERESAVLGDPFVLLRSGTIVVTPLRLLANDAVEYERGLMIPVDDEPAAVERDDTRVYRVGVSDGAALRGGGMLATTRSVCSSWSTVSTSRSSTQRVLLA